MGHAMEHAMGQAMGHAVGHAMGHATGHAVRHAVGHAMAMPWHRHGTGMARHKDACSWAACGCTAIALSSSTLTRFNGIGHMPPLPILVCAIVRQWAVAWQRYGTYPWDRHGTCSWQYATTRCSEHATAAGALNKLWQCHLNGQGITNHPCHCHENQSPCHCHEIPRQFVRAHERPTRATIEAYY